MTLLQFGLLHVPLNLNLVVQFITNASAKDSSRKHHLYNQNDVLTIP
jgi:hypothetical protein